MENSITNIAVDGKVNVTKDVTIFTPYKNNRKAVRQTVNTVKKGIKNSKWYLMGILTCAYIDGVLTVLDGNNRLKAIEECNKDGFFPPIYYIILDMDALAEQGIKADDFVQISNNSRKNWGNEDWVGFYCTVGNKDYLRYSTLADKYYTRTNKDGSTKPQYRYSANLVSAGKCGADAIKSGDLKVTLSDEVIEYHYNILESIRKSLGIADFSNSYLEQLIEGWYAFYNDPNTQMLLNRIGINEFLSRLSKYTVTGNDKNRVDIARIGKKPYWVEFFKMVIA